MIPSMPPIPVRRTPLPASAPGGSSISHFGDIDEQAAALQGWNQRYLQLSRGRFDGSVQRLQLDGVGLFIEDLHQSVHQVGWVRPDVFAIGVPLTFEGDGHFCGHRASSDALHVFSGANGFEFLSPQRHVMIGIEIDKPLCDAGLLATGGDPDQGWRAASAGLLQPDAVVLGRLRGFLVDLFQTMSPDATGDEATSLQHNAPLRRQVRCQLIDHIAAAMTPAESATPAHNAPSAVAQRALAQRASAFVAERLGEAPSVGEICVALGVSRRTLQSAFQATWGMGPLAWLTTMRLNAVRRRLKTAANVTDAATEFGFWHFGHFAGHYQALFGECPSQTLRHHRQLRDH